MKKTAKHTFCTEEILDLACQTLRDCGFSVETKQAPTDGYVYEPRLVLMIRDSYIKNFASNGHYRKTADWRYADTFGVYSCAEGIACWLNSFKHTPDFRFVPAYGQPISSTEAPYSHVEHFSEAANY